MTPRTLHFSPFFDFAGGNRSMAALVAAAAERAPTAALVPTAGALADHLRSSGATVYTSFKSEHLPAWKVLRAPRVLWSLFHAIRDFSPDLIHCHSAMGNHYCKWVKAITKLPLVTHQRDNYAQDYFHSDLEAADGVIAISEWVLSQLPDAVRERSIMILNPAPLPGQAPDARRPGPLRIGMAGRCIHEKGYDLVIDACRRLLAEHEFELHAWGVQDNDYGKKIKQQLKAFGDRAIIEPFRNDIDVFYRGMDIVVVPSRYPEPMGRMAIEAMAWETPVIAAGHGGLVELIGDGKTGLLFKPGSVDDLAAKLQQLIINSELRRRLASSGRRWVADNLDPARYAASVEAFYHQVLRRQSSEPSR